MYRFRLIHPLQDSVGLSLSTHFCLNLKYVGTGLGDQPVYTETEAKKKKKKGWGQGVDTEMVY